MKLNMRWIAVVLVVVIVALLYFAFVGTTKAIPNIGEDKDPTGGERKPIKYGSFTINVGIKNEYNRFDGKYYDMGCVLNAWVEGKELSYVYKMNLLGWFQDDVTIKVDVWITGPSNYISDKSTFSKDDNIPELKFDYNHYSFGPYVAFFYDTGQYTLHSELHVESKEFTGSIADYSKSFEV